MATNSDLKNNYSLIKVSINGHEVNTNSIKVGSFIADHSKLGIGTLLNTGSVIGFSANLFGAVLQEKYIPSFSWGSGKDLTEYELEKAIITARAVMKRRKIELTKEYESLMKYIFEATSRERQS